MDRRSHDTILTPDLVPPGRDERIEWDRYLPEALEIGSKVDALTEGGVYTTDQPFFLELTDSASGEKWRIIIFTQNKPSKGTDMRDYQITFNLIGSPKLPYNYSEGSSISLWKDQRKGLWFFDNEFLERADKRGGKIREFYNREWQLINRVLDESLKTKMLTGQESNGNI